MIREGARADASVVGPGDPGQASRAVASTALPAQRRALIVDDEPSLLNVVCRVAHSIGWRSRGYGDAEAAIDALQGDPDGYDLVLTDLRLGAQNGLEVAAAAVRLRPGIPVILLTGAPLPATMWDTAADAGVRMVIYKPFHLHELVDAMRALTECVPPPAPGGRLALVTNAMGP